MAKLKDAALDDEQKKELADLEEQLAAARKQKKQARDDGDDELARISESTASNLLEEIRALRKEQADGWALFSEASKKGQGGEGEKPKGFLEWLFEE